MENYQTIATQADSQIKNLLVGIQNLTVQMSNTFEQAILKHEEQFIKTYRIKICELTRLFEELTRVLEDKFINNALTTRLEIVMKERDYFKYECLKLNVQYQTALNEQKTLNSQVVNISDEMKIYKHLLEDEKLRCKELQKNADKFKSNFSAMAYKTLTENVQNVRRNTKDNEETALELKNKKIDALTKEIREKNEAIRGLKIKVSEVEIALADRQNAYFEKKQLYDTFKCCVNAWKREILTKERKQQNNLNLFSPAMSRQRWSIDKIAPASKKQLLKQLFTNPEFLTFISNLLFSPKFRVTFTEMEEPNEHYMSENRSKLFDYMRKKKVINNC